MKRPCYFLFVFLILGCTGEQKNKNTAQVSVTPVIVQPVSMEDICFMVDSSSYPEVGGMKDKTFERILNDRFRENFENFIEKESKGHSCDGYSHDDQYALSSIPASAKSDFEVLQNANDILSVVQYTVTVPGGGANAWSPGSIVLTANLKEHTIYDSKVLAKGVSIEHINKQIKSYFDQLFPGDEINYPYVKEAAPGEKNLDFAVRNDSLMMVVEAYPTAHYSHSIYIIPVGKWQR